MDSVASAALPPAPSVEAVSIEGSTRPVIDGDISDAIWSRARHIDRFYQFEPQSPAEPTERTEAWIMYDRERLYVAIHAHDSEPQNIAMISMSRDFPQRDDDNIRVLLDPRRSRREGYMFSVTAAGGRMDALIPADQQSDAIREWNMLWQAKTRRVADGWTAEFEIPFRGLSYDPAATEWGFDLNRSVRRKGESMRWSPVPPGTRQIDISYSGSLTGLRDMSQGNGLDLQVYGQAQVSRDWANDRDTVTGKPSATAYYKFTPSLTGLLTVNTDFSDKPLDTRQVNTTRFSLFEPETREFFLEDTDAFEFGSFGEGSGANGRPFFSRNIGLVSGRVVDLDVGAKVSGNIGGVRVGALSVRTAADNLVPAQTLSVARVSTAVLGESRLGGIVTSGDPTGRSSNQVAGVDFQYRNSSFRPGKRLEASVYAQRSFSDVRPDDDAFGVGLEYPNDPWKASLKLKQIGRDFRPALGFVNRPGVRVYEGEVHWFRRPTDSLARIIDVSGSGLVVTDLDGRLESRNDHLGVEIETSLNSKFTAGVDNAVEVIDAPFLLADTVLVPTGRYEFARAYASYQTSTTRPLTATWKLVCCEYFGGTSTESEVALSYRPNARFTLEFKHSLQPVHLPGGRTTIHIESLNTTVNFTPDMRLVSELQYDNVSHRFGGSLRYRWEIRPTTELLVTIGESALLTGRVPHGSYQSQATAFSVRLGHRFQF